MALALAIIFTSASMCSLFFFAYTTKNAECDHDFEWIVDVYDGDHMFSGLYQCTKCQKIIIE